MDLDIAKGGRRRLTSGVWDDWESWHRNKCITLWVWFGTFLERMCTSRILRATSEVGWIGLIYKSIACLHMTLKTEVLWTRMSRPTKWLPCFGWTAVDQLGSEHIQLERTMCASCSPNCCNDGRRLLWSMLFDIGHGSIGRGLVLNACLTKSIMWMIHDPLMRIWGILIETALKLIIRYLNYLIIGTRTIFRNDRSLTTARQEIKWSTVCDWRSTLTIKWALCFIFWLNCCCCWSFRLALTVIRVLAQICANFLTSFTGS